jgi:hypothetical protein
MRLGTAWFVIILVLLSIRVVQGFCPSSCLISRATVRRGSFRPLADGSNVDFESDEGLDAWNTMHNATNERLSSIDIVERLSSIDKVERFSSDKGRAAMQEASDNRDKDQMVAAAAFFAWVLVAPKVFEVLLASIPHATQ